MSAPPPLPRFRQKPVRWFYRWLLPLLWAGASIGGTRYPGDEYGLWGAGSVAGLWALFITGNSSDVKHIMPRVIGAGVVTIALAGWALDRQRAPRRLWLALWLVLAVLIGVSTLRSHESYERAIAKNGSIQAYVFFAANAGLYLAIVLAGLVTPIFRLHLYRPAVGKCPACGYNLTGNVTGRCSECGEDVADLVPPVGEIAKCE